MAAILRHAIDSDATEIEASAEAEEAWVAQFEATTRGFLGSPDCTPGYYNNEGRPPTRKDILNASGYPAGPVAFFDHIERWRTAGDFSGVEFRT